MGKTNPTYRDLLSALEDSDFRRGLRRRYQEAFDECILMARDRGHAGGMLHGRQTDPNIIALWSIVVTQQRRISELQSNDDGNTGQD